MTATASTQANVTTRPRSWCRWNCQILSQPFPPVFPLLSFQPWTIHFFIILTVCLFIKPCLTYPSISQMHQSTEHTRDPLAPLMEHSLHPWEKDNDKRKECSLLEGSEYEEHREAFTWFQKDGHYKQPPLLFPALQTNLLLSTGRSNLSVPWFSRGPNWLRKTAKQSDVLELTLVTRDQDASSSCHTAFQTFTIRERGTWKHAAHFGL